MKKKPDLKPGDVFWFYDAIGGKSERKFVKWNDDYATSDCGSRLHYLAIQGIRRKKRKPEVKALVTFECEWVNDLGVIRPRGIGVRPIIEPFLGKKTKVTIEVIE